MIDLSAIRRDYRDRVLTVPGMIESPEVWTQFKERSLSHLQFAVGTPDTKSIMGRQTVGILADHNMRVIYGFELAAAVGAARMVALDAMTDIERLVIGAIMAPPAAPPQYYKTTEWTGTTRIASGPSWICTELTFRAIHQLSFI